MHPPALEAFFFFGLLGWFPQSALYGSLVIPFSLFFYWEQDDHVDVPQIHAHLLLAGSYELVPLSRQESCPHSVGATREKINKQTSSCLDIDV